MQNAFKVNENILIFANLQLKKNQQTKKAPQKAEIFLLNKDKINKRYLYC